MECSENAKVGIERTAIPTPDQYGDCRNASLKVNSLLRQFLGVLNIAGFILSVVKTPMIWLQAVFAAFYVFSALVYRLFAHIQIQC